MLKKLDEKTIRFHLRKSFVTFAKRIIKDNRTFRRRMRTLGASTFCLKQTKWYIYLSILPSKCRAAAENTN